MRSVATYLRESLDELKKVQWPSRETTTQYSIIVILSVIVATSIFGFIDYGFTQLFELILNQL